MTLAGKCRKGIELVDKYRVNRKIHKKSKIGQTNEKLVLKSIKFVETGIKLVPHAGNVLANVHSLSRAGNSIAAALSSPRIQFVTGSQNSFQSYFIFLLVYVIHCCVTVCLN